MLILTRKIGEKIVIGEMDNIFITLLDVRGTQVRFGIEAPQNMPIHREEVYKQVLANQADMNQKTNANNSLMDAFRAHQKQSKKQQFIH